jgi:methionyl aminopeptidase
VSIEQEGDLIGLRRIGRVVARTLTVLRNLVRPGVTTAELDGQAGAFLTGAGARSAPQHHYGFPGATCISVNDEAVHGIPGARALRNGDLVKLDVTAEMDGFIADAAITVPVGTVIGQAHRLCAAAEAAFWSAASTARPGTPLSRVGRAVEAEVNRRGFRVLRDLCGHGVGRAIHEQPSVPNYADPRSHETLTRGLVIALEPIIAVSTTRSRLTRDGWTVRSSDGSLTAHFEHTIVITRHRPLILTAA